ncbi:MAG: hypothetical protein ACRDYA_09245 [Egibacteraceae bacterium]
MRTASVWRAVALGFLLVVAGCGGRAGGETVTAQPLPGVNFQADLRVEGASLAIAYEVRNGGGRTVLVVTDTGSDGGADLQLVDGGVVEIRQAVVAPSEGAFPPAVSAVEAVPLPSGHAHRQEFRLPLPLGQGRLYADGAPVDPEAMSGARLCVGIVSVDPSALDAEPGQPMKLGETPDVAERQWIACSDTVDLR